MRRKRRREAMRGRDAMKTSDSRLALMILCQREREVCAFVLLQNKKETESKRIKREIVCQM